MCATVYSAEPGIVHETIKNEGSFKRYRLDNHPLYRFIGRRILRLHGGAPRGALIGAKMNGNDERNYLVCEFTTLGKLKSYGRYDREKAEWGHSLRTDFSKDNPDDFMVNACKELQALYSVFNKFHQAEIENDRQKAYVQLVQAEQHMKTAEVQHQQAREKEECAKEQLSQAQKKYDEAARDLQKVSDNHDSVKRQEKAAHKEAFFAKCYHDKIKDSLEPLGPNRC